MNPDERHLSLDSFAGYLHTGVPFEHHIPGSPRIHLFTDPDRAVIGLRLPLDGDTAPVTGLEHLRVLTIQHQGTRAYTLTVTDPRLFLDAYPVLCAVADRVQLQDMPFRDALHDTLTTLGHLLDARERISRDREVGLLGELSLLAGLIRATGAGNALAAWRGGHHEEHDFGLVDVDVEVKTTTTEARSHWITSLNQLVGTGDRPLWLISYQVTTAGSAGTTLPDLVDRVRTQLTDTAQRLTFDRNLSAAGWRTGHADMCQQRWRLRTDPAAYHVDTTFPRLTPAGIAAACVDPDRIVDVRYRIDLTPRHPDLPTPALQQALATDGQELR